MTNEKQGKKKKWYLRWWAFVLYFFIVIVVLAAGGEDSKTSTSETPIQKTQAEQPAVSAPESTAGIATTPDSSIPQQETVPDQPQDQAAITQLYAIVSVTDGDTFKVSIDGKTEIVRAIGIDTPETVDPRKPVQCFGAEASKRAEALLTGKKVKLEADLTQGDRDKYSRLLRYAWLEDGMFFNKQMIVDGYAVEYTYNTPYKYQAEFKLAEAEARVAKRGLWADNACPQAPVPTNTNTNSAPAPTPVPPSTAKYDCSANKYNCTDFKTQKEAQAAFEYCGGVSNDVHQLDRDKDGEVCETLP